MSQQPETCIPYFVHEIFENMDDFHVGERQPRGQHDSFVPVTYKGKRCRIQSPTVTVMFGLTKYNTPGDPNTKYSLHISLKNLDKEVKEFADFMYLMDDFAKEFQINNTHRFWSSIRENNKNPKHKSPVLRLKINASQGRLLLDIEDTDGTKKSLPTEAEFDHLIKHHCTVKVIFEINPLWYAGNKFGISYRLLNILVLSRPQPRVQFRPS